MLSKVFVSLSMTPSLLQQTPNVTGVACDGACDGAPTSSPFSNLKTSPLRKAPDQCPSDLCSEEVGRVWSGSSPGGCRGRRWGRGPWEGALWRRVVWAQRGKEKALPGQQRSKDPEETLRRHRTSLLREEPLRWLFLQLAFLQRISVLKTEAQQKGMEKRTSPFLLPGELLL